MASLSLSKATSVSFDRLVDQVASVMSRSCVMVPISFCMSPLRLPRSSETLRPNGVSSSAAFRWHVVILGGQIYEEMVGGV